jgi:predicted phage-related endonuclease
MAKKNYIDLTNLSREDWKELRRLGIGGSDVGAILGKSEFKTPMDVYLSKVRPSEDDDDEQALRAGHGHEGPPVSANVPAPGA